MKNNFTKMKLYFTGILFFFIYISFAQPVHNFAIADNHLFTAIEKSKLENKLQSFHDSCNYSIKIQFSDKEKYPKKFDAHSFSHTMSLKEYTTYLLNNDKTMKEEGVLILIDTLNNKGAVAFADHIIKPQKLESWIVDNIESGLQKGSLYKSLDEITNKLISEMNCRTKEAALKQKRMTNIIGPALLGVVLLGGAAFILWMELLK